MLRQQQFIPVNNIYTLCLYVIMFCGDALWLYTATREQKIIKIWTSYLI